MLIYSARHPGLRMHSTSSLSNGSSEEYSLYVYSNTINTLNNYNNDNNYYINANSAMETLPLVIIMILAVCSLCMCCQHDATLQKEAQPHNTTWMLYDCCLHVPQYIFVKDM